MGNEASLEGGAGDGPLPPGGSGPGPGPGAGKPPSALAGGGQLPATGGARATAGPSGPGPGPGGGQGSVPRRLDPKEPLGSQRAASPTPKQPSATTPGRESPREPRAQGPEGQEADGPRRTLQVDSRTQRSGRSPSVSPDRGSTPTSPYSVPQIAPLPSSTLCPICKTSDLTSTPSQPNFNTCTQCHNKVCNQCGFNPNPHLTQVKEWLCLNCQMQRALGMDMTTAPRSKSQQQLHSPGLSPAHSPAKQPLGKPEQERARGPGGPQPGPRQAETARATSVPGPAPAAATPEVGKVSPQPSFPIKPSTAEPRPPAGEAPAKSATAAPSGPGAAEPTQEGLTGKLFGLGASLLTQASTLMSAQPEVDSQGQPAPSKGPPKIVFSDASKEAGPRPPGSGPGPGPGPTTGAKTEPGSGPRAQTRTGGTTSPKHGRTEHQATSKAAAKPKTTPKERATCPLCQAELNVGSKGPANYNTCTTCKLQVCNLCGFNPTPHLVEKTEWLCLNCQTKRLLEGSLGEPTPLPLPTSQQPPAGAPHHTAGTAPPKQKGPQGLSQPSGPPPAKATPLPTKASPLPTKASPQAKPARASEPSRTPSSAQEKKTGVPAKAEPVPKPPPETTLPPGTPKAKAGVRRTEPTTPITKAVPEAPKGGETEEPGGKPYSQDLSRSPQSLSDTGYSSDGISSSQSEITGIVRQEMEQLDSAGVTGPRPPSPSELHKVGSSMRPSLEAQGPAPSGERSRPPSGSAEEQKRRPRSLSIMPEAFNSDEELEEILEEEEDSTEWGRRGEQQDAAESSDDFGSQLRHDYVEDSSEGGLSPLPPQPPARAADLTDEEFMRRQILEMSAEEDNLEEDEAAPAGPGLAKHASQKGGPRPRPESSQEPGVLPKRRLPHNATTGYEELLSEGGPVEDVDGTAGALQGGLRRFKTIELNSTGSYSHELDMGPGPDPSLDREPELEMESLTGSPEDRSRGEHSSTLPASTPSYTSGTSPTSLSSLEEDSDSSPSRRQRLEEAKQQRKARHRSHGPLLPTIEDSSEEEELREEEELLREQEKMREVEQQRIRSTARKTRRDKEELRAQRRRERSKTPPSNLSPIEDASPTEELRQAAEMEELHRSSCSEYSPSPSLDSEAEAPEGAPSRLYKSGSEYNLPTFMALYSPTETPSGSATTPSSGRPLKSAEEAYEEMMRKAELLQRQQGQAAGGRGPHGGPPQPTAPRAQGSFEHQDSPDRDYGGVAQPAAEGTPAGLGAAVYQEILQTSQSIARMHQASSRDLAFAEDKKKEKQFLDAESAYMDPMKQNGGPLTPGTSPTQLAAPVSFATSSTSDSSGGRVIPDVRVTQHFAKEPQDPVKLHSTPASPSSTSKEVGIGFAQGLGASASMAVTAGPAGLPRGYMAPTSPAASERSPSPSFTGHGYEQSPATANYGSQTEELPQAPRGPAVSGRAAREKPLGMSEGESGPPQTSRGYPYFVSSSPPLSPSSPSESPTFSPGKLGPRATVEFSTQTPSPTPASDTPRSPGAPAPTPTVAQGTQTPHRPSTPRLVWQQPSQDAPFMVITLASDASSQTKMVHASASTSPVCSPVDTQPTTHSYSQTTPPSGSQPPEPPGPPGFPRAPNAGADGPLAVYGWGALPAENISLCRISSVPGTSRVEPGPRPPGSAVVDLRTAVKPTPIILTDQGMDLTSLAVEARKYGLALDPIPGRQSTAVQPLVINLNAQEQTHAFLSTATTVSITMASSVLMAQQKQPVVYGDPFQSRLDFGQGAGSPVCLAQVKQVEQAVQTTPYRGGPRGRPRETKFARYNLSNQVAPLARRDVLITQVGPGQSVGLKSGPVPEPGTEPHRAAPTELRSHALPGARKPHTVVVQVGEGAAGTVSTLLPEEPAGALDLTGMRPESQLACCDMVYKFPFGSSCTGSFRAAPSAPERSVAEVAPPGQSSGPFYSPRDPEPPEPPTYRAQVIGGPGPHEEQRPYPQGLPGRLYSSMSDTNLAEAGLNYHAHRFGQLFQGPGRDSAMDLSSLKHSYSLGFADGRYLGQGLQYGSFTDLRHPTDLLTHPLPMRRYSSVSNIYSDHRYGPRGDAAGFQEASLAQYSATTAREISRMCAALNSMDQYGGRHGSGGGGPDLMQYQPQPGLSAPQGLAPLRPGLLGNPTFPEGQGSPGNLAQYRPTAGQAAAVRQLLPSTATVRAADGMIYSTINTPIAATLPITTQPASVLRPMVRGGMYRPYPPGGVAAVPLASLTRMPVIAPRIPLGPTGLYRYPVPSRFPTPASVPPTEGPVYLGKPAAAKASGTGGPPRPELPAGAAREEPLSTAPPAAAKEMGAAPTLGAGQKPLGEATPGGGGGALGRPGLEKEDALPEERQRKQQEQLLQLERERVELEKLRQLRLQEELERERVELQRHREEEQLLVQRELQELQTLKHHVLQQQQEERQAQFALQREQLAQQRLQLEQIQQLQQQLQQQLEEQKQRQKPPFPMACEAPGRGPPPAVPELAQNGQYWPPLTHAAFIAVPEGSGQPREPMPHRGLPSSASDMSLQTEEPWEGGRSGGLKKRHSMPRLRDVCEPESAPEPCGVRRIADSSVQTDEEDGEGRYLLTRRRRARRSADCSVQTDDEDSAEWEQPVRRRRSRLSRHSDSGSDSKHDATASSSAAAPATRAMSSVGIQTISDCSVQTEPDQLPRVSPAIHITAVTDPKVEIVRYISAPEKTGRGESLACQTEPEGQAQGVAGPQLMGPTAISPYLPGIQIVTPGPLGRFEKKKPDPLEIGYQAHLPPESLSQLVSRQPPKSPQVLYSPVSPLSPHRLLDTSFASSERLNKAHVSPQKHFTADSAFRQQTLPRPMKTLQRSLSDPKPLSPTAEESAKERFPLYQHQGGLGSQVSAPPPNGLVRKVKRTLPSPPPEEAHLPLAGQAAPPQLYAASLLQRGLVGPTAVPTTKASLLRELDRDLRLVEHESTKLRKKQAELDEEEKEIDAKLKYLELGITQRKESLAKDRSGRDYPPLRGLSEHRDYLSDSELNQLRLQGCATPAGQYAEIPVTAAAAAPTTPSGSAAFQPPRFPPPAPLYPAGSAGPTQNGFAAHQAPTYPGPSTYPAPAFPPGASYPSEPGLPSQQAFRPPGHYTAQTPLPTTQTTLFPAQADSRAPHQKPRQTSLADLEQKVSTNYEVIASPVVAMSSAPSETSYSGPGPTASSSYEQGKAPELPRASDRSGVSLSPAPIYSSDSHYTSLEQTVPRNYVMIDDISELTKDSASAAPESQRLEPLGPSSSGRPAKEPGEPGILEGSALPCCYTRGEEESEEDSYEPRGKSGHHRGVESNGRPASTHYYSDSDYRHGTRADKYSPGPAGPKHPSKSLAPAAVPSKRSKHRKQGMEQKISKFSPIEEAKDVESDLASYPSSAVSSSLASRGRKFQDEITYGLKKNVYEQQRYYGVSSRDPAEEDDRVYGGSSRSRGAPAYSGEKLSSHDFGGRAKGYEREREAVERLQKAGPKPSSLSMAHGRTRPPMRSQASEEESPVSPLGRPRPAGGPLPPGDACPPFCSSHSMPDVQEHVKEGPRSHSYKRDEGYILDDSHCVVSDSEAYHLGQEETDWFDKPRDARSDRFRHHGGHAVSSSSQKRGPARHSYHDYDEPPEEGLWPHDEGGPGRHASAKEHRHHGDHGRHSGRHAGEEPSRRAAKPHVRDVGRHEARPHPQPSPAPAVQKKGQPGYPSSAEYSQPSRAQSAYHHSSESKKGSRQAHPGPVALQPKLESQPQPQGRQAAPGPQPSQPPPSRQMPSATASRQPQTQPQPQQGLGLQPPQQAPSQARLQQQGQPAARGPASAASQPAGKPQAGPPTATGPQPSGPPRAEQANSSKGTAKAPQQGRPPQAQPPPGPGPAGVKAGAKPGGTPGAPAGQPGAEGESVLSKILPGGAAEQAGKLTEAVSAFGKKFSSFW